MSDPIPYATVVEISKSKESLEAFWETYLYIFDHGKHMSDIEKDANRERLRRTSDAKRIIHFYSKEAFYTYLKKKNNDGANQ